MRVLCAAMDVPEHRAVAWAITLEGPFARAVRATCGSPPTDCVNGPPVFKAVARHPSRPGDNAHIEAFNSLVRRECLSQHWFQSLEEACGLLEAWKDEHNDRPHGSLRHMPQDRDEPETRRSSVPEKG